MKVHKFLYLVFFLGILSCSSDSGEGPVVEPEVVVPVQPLDASSTNLPVAIFTDPQTILEGDSSPVIQDRLISFIEAAPGGSSIHVSIYLFESATILEALKEAHSRAVKVHITIDNSSRSSNTGTISALKRLGEGMEVVEVYNDAGSIAIQHNKFVLFSALETEGGTLNNIVFQTSHNFVNSAMRKIQDAVILSNKGLFDAYLNYWNDMAKYSSGGMKNYIFTEYEDLSEGIGAQFFPKRSDGSPSGEDSVIEMLDNITDPAGTTVRIGMSDWADSRAHILDKLLELSEQGADIQVITKEGKGPEVLKGLKLLEENGEFVKIYSMEGAGEIPKVNIHMKVMMIDGMYKGSSQTIVMTGTQNFTNNAIWNNNETSLFLLNHPLYKEYEDHYTILKGLPGMDF